MAGRRPGRNESSGRDAIRPHGEGAELRGLIRRASDGAEFGAAFSALANKRNVPDGALSELQAERGLPGHLLPLDTLIESRAAITGLAGSPGQPQQFRPHVFPQGVAAFMGFDMPRVAYGTPAYPVFSTPVTLSEPGESAAAAETTGAIAADALGADPRTGLSLTLHPRGCGALGQPWAMRYGRTSPPLSWQPSTGAHWPIPRRACCP